MKSLVVLIGASALLVSAVGCAGGAGDGSFGELGDIGAPCELEEHCVEGLTCDFHSEYGSCQEPHDH